MSRDLVLCKDVKPFTPKGYWDLCERQLGPVENDYIFLSRVTDEDGIMLVASGQARWQFPEDAPKEHRAEIEPNNIPKEFADAVAAFCVGKLSRPELREMVIKYCPDAAKKHGVTYSAGTRWG